ncbi:hypothetical protein QNA24_25130 [Rhodococcus qingshengii]|nr:hypothetical protein [Rhodococcus qingshengii]
MRDPFLDHSKIPDKQIGKGHSEDPQKALRAIINADRSVQQNISAAPWQTKPLAESSTTTPLVCIRRGNAAIRHPAVTANRRWAEGNDFPVEDVLSMIEH